MKNLQGWMILGIACLAGCVGTTIPVQAQQTATAIVVKERLVEHVGDRLIIDMKLALDELSLPVNRSLVCTPLIERGDSVRALPPVIVNGRNRRSIRPVRARRRRTGVCLTPLQWEGADVRLPCLYSFRQVDGAFGGVAGSRFLRLRLGGVEQ